MAYLQITEAQANALRALRAIKASDKAGYKDARRALFTNIREQLGVPGGDEVVLAVEVDDRNSPLYRVLKARPPKSKNVSYVPLEAGPDNRLASAASKPVLWASLPLADVVALMQEQGETMEGYKPEGEVTRDPSWQCVPAGREDDGVELFVTADERVLFRLPEA